MTAPVPEEKPDDIGDVLFYNVEDGAETPNDGPRFTSRELENLTVDQLSAVIRVKRELGGTVVAKESPL